MTQEYLDRFQSIRKDYEDETIEAKKRYTQRLDDLLKETIKIMGGDLAFLLDDYPLWFIPDDASQCPYQLQFNVDTRKIHFRNEPGIVIYRSSGKMNTLEHAVDSQDHDDDDFDDAEWYRYNER